jgi:BTB/POZ domain
MSQSLDSPKSKKRSAVELHNVRWAPEPKNKSDVTIISLDGDAFYLHKVVLQLKSPVFLVMDEDGWEDIKFDYSSDILMAFFQIIYGEDSKPLIHLNNVLPLVTLSVEYGIVVLEQYCRDYIIQYSSDRRNLNLSCYSTVNVNGFDLLLQLQKLSTQSESLKSFFNTVLSHVHNRMIFTSSHTDANFVDRTCGTCSNSESASKCRVECRNYFTKRNVTALRGLSDVNRIKLLLHFVPINQRALLQEAFN